MHEDKKSEEISEAKYETKQKREKDTKNKLSYILYTDDFV